jgi:hypothetical protein
MTIMKYNPTQKTAMGFSTIKKIRREALIMPLRMQVNEGFFTNFTLWTFIV